MCEESIYCNSLDIQKNSVMVTYLKLESYLGKAFPKTISSTFEQ
jgi:hypothetical protein